MDEHISAGKREGCQLLDSFAIFVQLLLASIAFSTLIIKRQREEPRRPIRIWGFDISKQIVGGIVIHTLNLVLSYLSGYSLEDSEPSNPCVWYWLNIFVDTTLGTGVIWAILHFGQYLTRQWGLSGFQSGVYGNPPFRKQFKRWVKQLMMYVTALITMKLVVLLLFKLCPWLEDFGEWVLGWTLGNHKLQVVFVLLLFPLIMNIIQFWIVDTIVKHNFQQTPIYLDDALDEDILIPIYDDDDDDYNTDDGLNNRLEYNDAEDGEHYSSWPPGIHSPLLDDERDAVSLSSSLKPLTDQQDTDSYLRKNEHDDNPWAETPFSQENHDRHSSLTNGRPPSPT